ncbi:LacI family transcriptional regulator [Polaribacter sp. Z014]|uniref:LacI family DNA-binding transcriptional regulator n=1 Tax=Polaribacter sp. Z014 TaxID=2927126 RepID=UPI0020224452|nr:LacI family DNA-binding transcriptional regulator [Polaribacter sp. Z014]MCL7762641.1 LacI family transcriptional regulator [Polaribacter sp. Z014]
MKTPTIKDIAELAGVSKGTVDRVIHERGKVSTKALEKVNKVLKELNYKPNLLARSLKKTKDYHICVVIPDFHEDYFWFPCNEGINEAINEFTNFGVVIEPFFFNPTDTQSFIDVNNNVLDAAPDAVLLAPLFYKETVKIVRNYVSKKIIVSKFNNQLEIENTKNFVGQDLFKSGRIAASLLRMLITKPSTIAIIHIDEDYNNAIHMQEKEKGFRNYFKEFKNTDYNIETYYFKQSEIANKLETLFKESTNLVGIFVTTSKIHKVSEYIEEQKIKNIKIIGYDLLDENIYYLKKDIIQFLIHQNPRKQVYLGITYLVEYFLFEKPIPAKSLLPIDIITSENLDTYIGKQ